MRNFIEQYPFYFHCSFVCGCNHHRPHRTVLRNTTMKTAIFSVLVYPGFFGLTYWAGLILTR